MARERPKSTMPILFSVIIVDLIGFGIVLPILPYYADRFHASGVVLGLLLATHAALQFVFAPIWGRLSDRIGRRPVMLFTIAGTGLALATLGFAPSLAWLFIARAMSGVFAANISVATAYLSDVTDEEERTSWMGKVGASFAIGFTLGPAIGGLFAPYGLGVPMFIAAGMAAVNCLYALFVLPEPEREQRAGSTPAPVGLRETLRDRLVGHLCLTNFVFTFAVTQLESIFAYFMIARFDYGPSQVAAILVLMAFVMGGIQGGAMHTLAARFGERSLLTSGLLIMAIAFIALPSIHAVWPLLLPLAIIAAGRAIAQPPLASLVSMEADPANRGAVMGAFQSSAALARIFGPVAAGALYDLDVGNPFYLASSLLFASCLLALKLPARSPAAAP